jgi:hypothetical protein
MLELGDEKLTRIIGKGGVYWILIFLLEKNVLSSFFVMMNLFGMARLLDLRSV